MASPAPAPTGEAAAAGRCLASTRAPCALHISPPLQRRQPLRQQQLLCCCGGATQRVRPGRCAVGGHVEVAGQPRSAAHPPLPQGQTAAEAYVRAYVNVRVRVRVCARCAACGHVCSYTLPHCSHAQCCVAPCRRCHQRTCVDPLAAPAVAPKVRAGTVVGRGLGTPRHCLVGPGYREHSIELEAAGSHRTNLDVTSSLCSNLQFFRSIALQAKAPAAGSPARATSASEPGATRRSADHTGTGTCTSVPQVRVPFSRGLRLPGCLLSPTPLPTPARLAADELRARCRRLQGCGTCVPMLHWRPPAHTQNTHARGMAYSARDSAAAEVGLAGSSGPDSV